MLNGGLSAWCWVGVVAACIAYPEASAEKTKR
jgi:hypothetical protein